MSPVRHGNVFVLSAPSGTGKSTLSQRLVATHPDLIFSISYTTRAPRPGEVDGKDYFFVDDATFDEMVADGAFVEWVQVYEKRYGTSRGWLEEVLSAGLDVLLDIETTGAMNLRKTMPEATMVFLLPPSAADLEARLRGRGKDSEEQIKLRLRHARHELELYHAYDYLVVNENLESAYQMLEAVVLAARARQVKMAPTAEAILKGF